MSVIRCKDCQYFDGIKECARHENLKNRSPYDECVEFPNTTNNEYKIKCLLDQIQETVNTKDCFSDSEEKYHLENNIKKLLTLVYEHGVDTYKNNQ